MTFAWRRFLRGALLLLVGLVAVLAGTVAGRAWWHSESYRTSHGERWLAQALELESAILVAGSEVRQIGASEVALVPPLAIRLSPWFGQDEPWQPAWAQIEQAEHRIRRELRRRWAANEGASRKDLAAAVRVLPSSRRQYAGLTMEGRRVIYVVSFPNHFDDGSRDWRFGLVSICDGGPEIWEAWWDPQTDRIELFLHHGA